MNYIIKDADGNITNPCIKASAEFVEANFEHYELWVEPTPPEPTAEEAARQWRDNELQRTDIAATVSDYPNAEAILAYRQALRDWPATDDFPDTRPEVS
jgi:hypothetical protein